MTAEFINGILLKYRNPERAIQMKAYMKDQFEFLGISAPERKWILRDVKKESRSLNKNALISLINHLWKSPYRESQYSAMLLIDANLNSFDGSDLYLAERWISRKSWWDTVDHLATHLAGEILDSSPELRNAAIGQWMSSDDIWLQRTCLLFQLFYREKTDFELLKALIYDLQNNKEFFIQKAIGWALRQYSKQNPQAVLEFVETSQLTGLAAREAMKWLKRHK